MLQPDPSAPALPVLFPHAAERFGPWLLLQVAQDQAQIRMQFCDDGGHAVQFRVVRLGPGVRRGPFDLPGLAITYDETQLDYTLLAPLGEALRSRLAQMPLQPRQTPEVWRRRLAEQVVAPLQWRLRVRADAAVDPVLLAAIDPEVVQHVTLAVPMGAEPQAEIAAEQLRTQGVLRVTLEPQLGRVVTPLEVPTDGALEVPMVAVPELALPHTDSSLPWQERARQHLRDQPGKSLRLGQLLDVAHLPDWPCTLPWTRLEVSQGGGIGPCCIEYQAERFAAVPPLATALWNGPAMQAFRRAMQPGPETPSTCRATCPVLVGQSQRAADVRLRGGPRVALDSQIAAIEDMLAGRLEVRGAPLTVCLATTSFCNYDCLMCPCGEEGKLEDQLPEAFYADLQTLLPGVQVLDANGGEPLASPTFRDFLTTLDAKNLSQLQVNLVTNGSYLAPKLLDKLARVPFGNITLSLNAATPESYLLVNRGLPYERVRAHLDDLLARQKAGMRGELTYSMVILKQNFHEIEAFAELALQDGVHLRYMLPFRNRHESSILTDRTAMLAALRALQRVAARLLALGRGHEARDALTSANILLGRLDARVLAPL